jgi:hypothetical protein
MIGFMQEFALGLGTHVSSLAPFPSRSRCYVLQNEMAVSTFHFQLSSVCMKRDFLITSDSVLDLHTKPQLYVRACM